MRQVLVVSLAMALGVVFLTRLTAVPAPILAQENEPAAAPSASPPVPPAAAPADEVKSHVVVITVDSEAAQSDFVREVITALEKRGIASTKPEIKADPSDVSHDLTLVLGIKPTESYKKIEELIAGLADLKRVRRLRFAFQAKPMGSNEVSIVAGSNVPMAEVQLVQEYLAQQKVLGLDQTTVRRTPPDQKVESAQPAEESLTYRATLLKVKSDWSQVPAATEIETELRVALKNVSVPGELLDKLPGSGPKILFAPNLVGLYSTANYAQVIAWLRAKELVGTATQFGNLIVIPPKPLELYEAMPRNGSPSGPQEFQVSYSQNVEPSDFPNLPPPAAQPFVKRQLQQRWQILFSARGKEDTAFSFERQLVDTEQTRGSDEVVIRQALDQYRRSFRLPDGYVAIINANSSEIKPPSDHRNSIESLLIIERIPTGPAAEPATPQLHLPDKVQTLSEPNSFGPRGGRGAPGMNSPAMSMVGGMSPGGSMPPPARPVTKSSRQPSTQETTQTPATKPEDALLSYAFKQLDAHAAAELVNKLFSSPQFQVAVDPRVNQLLIRGNPDSLKELTAILEKLDSPPAKSPKNFPVEMAGPPRLPINSNDATEKISSVNSEQLRKEYQAADQRTLNLATTWRETLSGLPPDDPQRKQLENQLREAVTAAFTARQQLLQTEVVEFQQRALRIQQSIQLRSRIQDMIVERRVVDLLNPNLQWETSSIQAPSALTPVPPAGPTAARVLPPIPYSVAAPIDPALSGVWELTLPDGKPAPNGLRLVFLKNHLAIFINGQRTSSWWVGETDTHVTPHRIALLVCEGLDSNYGIYEIKGNGLRLNVGRDPQHKLTTFATTRPEFRRVSTEVPAELRESMLQIPPLRHPRDSGDAKLPAEVSPFQTILPDVAQQSRPNSAPRHEDSLILRNADEFRTLLDAAAETLDKSQALLDQLLAELRLTNKSAIESDLQQAHPKVFEERLRGQRRRQFVRDELAAQITLLKVELDDAQSAHDSALAAANRLRQLVERGVVPTTEFETAEREAERTRGRLRKAQTLLELYLKVDPPITPNTGDMPTGA